MHRLDELRAELEAGLTEAILHSGRGRVSPAEASSSATAVLSGQGLPAAIAERFGSDPVCSLVTLDADRIQSWVFASERVQVAQGASSTLAAINRNVAKEARTIAGIHGTVYSAGGGGILLGDASLPPAELELRVRGWLERDSHELTFTVVSLPLFAHDFRPSGAARPLARAGAAALDRFEVIDGLGGALVRLQVKVREAKEARPRRGGPPVKLAVQPGMASERCPSCNRRPPARSLQEDDGPETWCPWCRNLRRVARSLALDRDARHARDGRSITFADLAEASNRRRQYLGFVAIDGNGMGGIVQGVRDLLQLRAFSEATTAVYEEARGKVEEVLARGFLDGAWNPAEASLSLLSGGDEITLVLPAAAAPLAAVETLRAIESGFDAATAPGGLLHEAFREQVNLLDRLRSAGAAAGLVTAASHYPVRLLRHYANELQKEAKRACALGRARSGLAWTLLTDSSPLPEGLALEGALSDLELGSFERFLEETRATGEMGVPRSALQRLVSEYREEDEKLGRLPDEVPRERVLQRLAANFFRYQLARNRELARWWEAVAPPAKGAGEGFDAIDAWFEAGGGERLERMVDLLSLDPFPAEVQEAVR